MTRIRISVNDFRIETEGHAKYADVGQDIVCAGISALTQSLLAVLMQEQEDGYLTLDWSMDPENAVIRIRARPYSWRRDIVRAYFRMTLLGLKSMEEGYGEYMTVIEEGQDDGDV